MSTPLCASPSAPPPRHTAIEAVCTLIRQQNGQDEIPRLALQNIANTFSEAFGITAPLVNDGGDIGTLTRSVEPAPTTPQLELHQSEEMFAGMMNDIQDTHLGDYARAQLHMLASELHSHVPQPGR
jgi:hypothetical protein